MPIEIQRPEVLVVMADVKRHLIRHSVEDAIRILESVPVRGDMIVELPIIETINRVSLAHLHIERAMKFLISEAGQTYEENHHLPLHLKTLRAYEPETVSFLEDAFDDAVRHYRYNPNRSGMGHLKSLVAYLEAAGSHDGFIDIRYWDLDQSLDEVRLRRISLNLHLELLHALSEVLLSPNRPKDTVSMRVERAVIAAINNGLRCFEGSDTASAANSYVEWVTNLGFKNHREAIAAAFKEGLSTVDDYTASVVRSAQRELLNSADPAVAYFADLLDVLPKQPRDVIPCVEWLGPEKEVTGMVQTPAGTFLGRITKGYDGIWRITPARDGRLHVSAKAEKRTDALCYLAALLTRTVQVTVDGQTETRRIVNKRPTPFWDTLIASDVVDGVPIAGSHLSGQSYKIPFWENDHGLAVGDSVKIEIDDLEEPISSLVQIIEGAVTEVADHEVSIWGSEMLDIRPDLSNS